LPEWGEVREDKPLREGNKKYSWVEISTKTVIAKLPKGNGEFIEEIIPPGEYKQEIDFELNIKANIWKIYSL